MVAEGGRGWYNNYMIIIRMRGLHMLAKNQIMSELTSIIAAESMGLQKKNTLGLTDDNKLWENIIKTVLNMCYGYDLANLNEDRMNYPGVDLGDYSQGLAFQVTATKTGAKVENTLDTVLEHEIYKSFKTIKIFVLGVKQKSYAVDFTKYQKHFNFSTDDIMDFNDLLKKFSEMDCTELKPVLEYMKEELPCVTNGQKKTESEQRIAVISLKNYFNTVYDVAKYITDTERIRDFDFDKKYFGFCDSIIDLLDDRSYEAAQMLLETIGELKAAINKSERRLDRFSSIDLKCDILMYAIHIKNLYPVIANMNELAERLSNDEMGLTRTMDIIIDGSGLFERISSLEIDMDIIEKQFIMTGLKYVVEESLLRKCGNMEIWFDEVEADKHRCIVDRIKAERGTFVEIYKDKTEFIDRLMLLGRERKDFVLISRDSSLARDLRALRVNGSYFYGVNIGNDMPGEIMNQCHHSIDIEPMILRCFKYDEEKEYRIDSMTLEQFREMIANGNDMHSNQIRVWPGGIVYLSRKVGADDIGGLQFRWETSQAGNGYVGPQAASKANFIQEEYLELKSDWKQRRIGYLDY